MNDSLVQSQKSNCLKGLAGDLKIFIFLLLLYFHKGDINLGINKWRLILFNSNGRIKHLCHLKGPKKYIGFLKNPKSSLINLFCLLYSKHPTILPLVIEASEFFKA